MATILQAPEKLPEGPRSTVFIAGGLDVNDDWQSRLIDKIKDLRIIVNNSRPTVLTDSETAWKEHLKWESDIRRDACYVICYFTPTCASDTTLVHLGYCIGAADTAHCCYEGPETLVVCSPDYPLRTLVHTLCEHHYIKCMDTLEEAADHIRKKIINGRHF
jgi:hypothetical protein